jgi:hypothetical protein
MPLYAFKSLINRKVQYSYHDYIEAWYKVLLNQNESFTHSWFINFDKKFKGFIPLWFLRWWQVHGRVIEILPEEVQEAMRYFSTVKNLSQQEAQLPITIHFFARYKISWILKWQYVMSQNNKKCIARQFSVKWWDKFDFSRVLSRLYLEFPFKSEAQPLVAQTQSPEPIIEPLSQDPKSDSPTSSNRKRPAKKDFKAFALSLAEQFYEQDEEEADEESTAKSSVPRSQFDLFQDAQDPFDAYDLSLDY